MFVDLDGMGSLLHLDGLGSVGGPRWVVLLDITGMISFDV